MVKNIVLVILTPKFIQKCKRNDQTSKSKDRYVVCNIQVTHLRKRSLYYILLIILISNRFHSTGWKWDGISIWAQCAETTDASWMHPYQMSCAMLPTKRFSAHFSTVWKRGMWDVIVYHAKYITELWYMRRKSRMFAPTRKKWLFRARFLNIWTISFKILNEEMIIRSYL